MTGDPLGSARLPAKGRVRRTLQLEKGAEAIESRRVTMVDCVPMAFGANYHDAAQFPDIAARRDDLKSLTKVYRSYGINDYLRGDRRDGGCRSRVPERSEPA